MEGFYLELKHMLDFFKEFPEASGH